MTTLAQGLSIAVAPKDNGTISIATGGGFGTAVITPTVGSAQTINLGPAPERRVLGPFGEGASIILSNQSCASFDYDGQIVGATPASYSLDSSGNVTGLVGPGGDAFYAGKRVRNNKDRYPFIDCTAAANITDFNIGTVTGATITTDTSVLFDGQPTIRVDIPAGAPSGTIRLGLIGASVTPPASWDGSRSVVSMMSSNTAGVGGLAGFYWSDSGFTNYYLATTGNYGGNYPDRFVRANEWWYMQFDNPTQRSTRGGAIPPVWGVGAGTPTFSNGSNTAYRPRLTFSYTSQGSAMSFWLGFCGLVGARRPKCVITLDDGYASWASFFVPLCKYYNLPVSVGVIKNLIGTGGYMTQSQLQSMINDQSGLVAVVPHATVHQPYDQGTPTGGKLTLAQYVADVNTCRDWLKGLGNPMRNGWHHPIVQSLSDNNLIDAMVANGYKTMRMGATSYFSSEDQTLALGDKMAMNYYGGAIMDSAHDTTASAVMTKVNKTVTLAETIFIEGHDFTGLGSTPPSWPQSEAVSLVQQLAALRDAGTMDFYTWPDWWDSVSSINQGV
jgi:hypothetical protein